MVPKRATVLRKRMILICVYQTHSFIQYKLLQISNQLLIRDVFVGYIFINVRGGINLRKQNFLPIFMTDSHMIS